MAKINPADIEAQKNLNTELECAKRRGSRASGIALISLCLLMIFGFGIAIHLKDHPSFSPEENRTLTTDIELSASDILDGSATGSINSFYTDQFPFRSFFLKLKALCELGAVKYENNGVIVGSHGYIVKKLEYTDYSNAERSALAAKLFSEKLKADGKAVSVAITPRSIDVLRKYIPDAYAYDRSDAIWSHIDGSGLEYVDLRDELTRRANGGENVYFKTDHHWTTLGAYVAYVELADELGYEPLSLDKFRREVISEEFFGTTHSSAGLSFVSPDTLELFRYEGDDAYTVEIVNGNVAQNIGGLYDLSKLDTKDKYSVFLSGNPAHMRVSKGDGEREKLVIIKDSFANSLVPFLAIHYDLEIIDVRYFTDSIYGFINENGIDNVLVLYNADSMATSDALARLAYGLN